MERKETNDDEKFMRLALNEARKALDAREVQDPTAHAEMQALTAATATLGGKYLTDCTLYVTVEPCIMCAGAIGWAQVGRVVWGADDAKKGYRRYAQTVFHPKTVVARGVLAGECEELMTSFFAGLRD